MSDIVRYLLTPPFGTETTERLLMERAAAEINRLREELAAYRARKPVVYSPDAQAMSDRVKAAEAERDALREEVSRLIRENKVAFEAVGGVVKANDKLKEENARLREALKDLIEEDEYQTCSGEEDDSIARATARAAILGDVKAEAACPAPDEAP